ncbi:MAG: M4 family metallopeptidase [Ginsengibacter sp.]
MKHLKTLLILFLLSSFLKGFSQTSLSAMKAKLDLKASLQTPGIKMTIITPSQAGILFPPENIITTDQSVQWLATQLDLRQGIDVLSPENNVINTGEVTVNKLHQYFKGIKVEHGVINTTNHNGKVAMMQLEYYPINDNFETAPVLTEPEALKKAIDFTGASEYSWTGYTGNDPEYMLPHGELVIVRTYKDESELCLAYKFEITALSPFSKEYVYVNAGDGTIVLNDPIIKHANTSSEKITDKPDTASVVNDHIVMAGKSYYFQKSSLSTNTILNDNEPKAYNSLGNTTGTADTRFLGQQSIITDNSSGVTGYPYRLREVRNGQQIITLNYNRQPYNTTRNNEALATEFLDDDNNWTAAEFHNLNRDDAALDVQFNMQVVSDYWKIVHNRNGWDNKNGELRSYVHVFEAKVVNNVQNNYYFDNAYWNGKNMHFGEGSGDLAHSNSQTPFDVTAHEMGHGITGSTSDLVYQWESGAMNEAFSDIWAACITNYAKIHYASFPGEITWRLFEKCDNQDSTNKGSRDMSNPLLFKNPSTYKSKYWVDATLRTCRVFAGHDNCGVHTNSGVLNKWFFLITDGETSFNTLGTFYSVAGLGFGTSQKIAYLTSINLPPNATYATAKTVSINATETLYGSGSTELQTVKAAWIAVAVDSNIYNTTNTPVFTSNNFLSIAVGKNGDVWAGTAYNGLYHYDGTAWEKRTEIPNVRINDIKADQAGNIWIAQSGTQANSSQALAGGINYLKAPYGVNDASFYTIGSQANIPSRNAKCIFVDTSRVNDGTNPKVWVATQSYLTTGDNISMSGMLGQGLYSTTKYFHNVSDGLNVGSGTAGVSTVGGNSSELWAFAPANNGINQLLTYNPGTNAFLTYYDHITDPILPSGFVARSIYGDARKRIWIGLANNGLMVLDENRNWHYVNLPASVVPVGTQATPNAIAGDKWGDIYIGTTNGILFFDRGDGLINNIDNPKNYKMFTKDNGLPSNQVNAIAYDTSRFKLMVATDNGVAFFEPLCVSPYCKQYKTTANAESESLLSGNWSNPAIWSNNKLPDSLTVVSIKNNIVVDVNAQCRSLSVIFPGSITVKTGANLTLYEDKEEIIIGAQNFIRSVGGTGIIKKSIKGNINNPAIPVIGKPKKG